MDRSRLSRHAGVIALLTILIGTGAAADTGDRPQAQEPQGDTPKKPGGFRGLMQRAGDKVKAKIGSESASETESPSNGALNGRPTVKQTELAGFFDKHPQPGAGKVALWPRVAIMMVAAPPWHLGQQSNLSRTLVDSGCWEFTAKIWDSPTQSRDVPSFFKCTEEGIKRGGGSTTEWFAFDGWSGLESPDQLSLQTPGPLGSTGAQRTLGPTPPDTPLPSSVAYRRRVFQQTYSGLVIREIVNATSLDYAAGDHRLWVNLAPELEPGAGAK